MSWTAHPGYEDIRYQTSDGIAEITSRRPDEARPMAFAGSATLVYCTTDEDREGKDAFLEPRTPDFSKFPRSR